MSTNKTIMSGRLQGDLTSFDGVKTHEITDVSIYFSCSDFDIP